MRISWKILLPIAVLLLVGVYSYYRIPWVDPPQLTVAALDKTHQVKSYRFRVEARLFDLEREISLSQLEGERSPEGNWHLKGQMTG